MGWAMGMAKARATVMVTVMERARGWATD
jgi:hypothetical protein